MDILTPLYILSIYRQNMKHYNSKYVTGNLDPVIQNKTGSGSMTQRKERVRVLKTNKLGPDPEL